MSERGQLPSYPSAGGAGGRLGKDRLLATRFPFGFLILLVDLRLPRWDARGRQALHHTLTGTVGLHWTP